MLVCLMEDLLCVGDGSGCLLLSLYLELDLLLVLLLR